MGREMVHPLPLPRFANGAGRRIIEGKPGNLPEPTKHIMAFGLKAVVRS